MVWNAIVVLVASLAVLLGLREGIRYTLLSEVDDSLRDDFQELSLALCNVFEASNSRLHAQLTRKARGHTQRAWFVQLAELPSGEGEFPASNDQDSQPSLIWSSFNVPDWPTLGVPEHFDRFAMPSGIPITIGDYRIMEDTVHDAMEGPVRVRLGASLRSIMHGDAVIDRLILIQILILVLIAPLGGYLVALRATEPLKQMIRTTERIKPTNLAERLPIRNTSDEIDKLSQAFNHLLDRIADYLTKRQDFLANSAHELRTPLAALRSSAELALRSQRSAQDYRQLLESVVEECGNLESLVNQLLLLAESESAHFESSGERVDLTRITSDACDMFGAVAESREVRLECAIAGNVAVDGSRIHLRQLLNNLIDNAIKFTPAGGVVAVYLRRKGQEVELEVRDTGIGIAENEQRRLFERFYRGDRTRRRNAPTRGTGLGLSICKAVAEAHGGTIRVTSQPGAGTSFVVTLPQAGGGIVS